MRIRKGALGGDAPDRDLVVSPQHRMLLRGRAVQLLFGRAESLVPAKALLNGVSVTPEPPRATEYIHLLFDDHQIVFANGAPTESLHPGRAVIDGLDQDGREQLFELFPELRDGAEWPSAAPALTMREARALAATL